jgi:geranylgeranyl diphosphate synthase type I
MTTHPQRQRQTAPGRFLDAMLSRVEERLRGLVLEEHRRWRAVDPRAATLVGGIAELVRAGGDRVRPVICLTGYLAAGGDPDAPEAVEAAAALEFLDTCLLIRSDVRDNAPLRRGLPTLHVSYAAEHERNGWRGESRRFGEGTAVLAGDLALAYGDRLAAQLPPAAWQYWDELRTARVIGSHTIAAVTTEYLDDPWPGSCISGCGQGCTAGWYALHHPLLVGAALAGRPDLAGVYEEFARPLHAAWRLRGFLEDGPGYDWNAQLVREILFQDDAHDQAERTITDLVHRATRVAASARLAPGWRTELGAFATRVAARG